MTAVHEAPVLLIHGGAGVDPEHDYSQPAACLHEVLLRGQAALVAGAAALDLVVDAVAEMESSGLFIAGKGSSANSVGEVELDASVMNGADGAAGAVAAVRNVRSPVQLARRVMQHTPHVMLAGPGAERFARAEGVELVAQEYYSPAVAITGRGAAERPHGPLSHGTVGAVALDIHGNLAAATSTGGTLGKLQGRVGGVPLPVAANWADRHVAVSCTGVGEFFMRAATAHDLSARVRLAGVGLDAAGDAVLDALTAMGGEAGFIAVDRQGNAIMRFNTAGMKRGQVRVHGAPQVAVR